MFIYVLRRIVALIPVLFVVSTVTFLIVHLTPGDPTAAILGEEASAERRAELRETLGLNAPLYEQYFRWISGIVRGDLGDSYFMQESVAEAIVSHVGPTATLALIAALIGSMMAIPAGILAARHRGSGLDQAIMSASLVGMSTPSFLLGLFLALLFGVSLGLLPVAGYEPLSSGLWQHVRYLILPATALGAMQAALFVRMTRSSMLESLNTDYVKAARAKGATERRVVYRHALRNSLLPILTVIGQSFGGLITGAVVTETIFNIPGLGQLLINSVMRRDLAVIQGIVLVTTFGFVMINLLVDILYGIVDPRVRLARR